jgi:ribosome-associated protein
MSSLRITEHLEIPNEQLEWSFARSSGPGGQNVNKVNSKATLRWTPTDPPLLLPAAWKRFCRSAKRYLTSDGQIVIQSQEHRDQPQNIESCQQKLRTLLLAALTPPKRRIATKPTKASRQRRLDNKQRRSDKKKSRQFPT